MSNAVETNQDVPAWVSRRTNPNNPFVRLGPETRQMLLKVAARRGLQLNETVHAGLVALDAQDEANERRKKKRSAKV